MPNEVTSLLNTLNRFITCPVCKFTNEIEIILTCGHLICINCKTKRTKCPVCYCELAATKSHSASIKFITELRKELLNASKDKALSIESCIDVGNSISTQNAKGESISRNDFERNIKENNNNVDLEIRNDFVKVIDTFRNKDNYKKNSTHKKRVDTCRDHCKHKEQEIYKNILKDFGIAGIDKQISKFKSNNTLIARERALNGHLDTIITRLNDHYEKSDFSGNTKFNYCLKMDCDSDSSDSDLMNFNDSIHNFDGTHNSNKNGLSLTRTCGSLKRKNSDLGTDEGPYKKTFLSSTDIMDDCSEYKTVNLDKKLGSIVDETEILQRYLNSSTKGAENEINHHNYLHTSHNDSVMNKSNILNEVPSSINKRITVEEKCVQAVFKKESKDINSDLSEEISLNIEEDGLQSDIIADMLHNVSNEIVVVGNSLCVSEKNAEIPNSSYDRSNLKNDSCDTSCKVDITETNTSTVVNETEENGDVIVVSDSDDDQEVMDKHSVPKSSESKTDQSEINLKQDFNVMNCKIILEEWPLLACKSVCNTKQEDNEKFLESSNVKNNSSMDGTASVKKPKSKHKTSKKGRIDEVNKKGASGKISEILVQDLPKLPFEQKSDEYDANLNDFEGFTEDDILILTVKLALFKMNGCKYSKSLSSSSLYSLDGKQILIKDVSEEVSNPDSPCCPNKIPDLTIEISDSEDESCKSLVTSSVQTDNEFLAVTPSPSTSKIRPVSLVKLRGFEIETEKFMKNDVLDIRKPLTPNTPIGNESIASSVSQNSPTLRSTPVSRRQLSFITSPSFENNLQYQDEGASTSGLKPVEKVPISLLNDDWQVLHNRMQHMVHSNPEDTLHSEFENSGVNATRLTFTTCGLNSKETALVTKLAQMTKSCLTKDFTHSTTHLVIGAAGRGRLEYYLAIAYRAFIVTMDWVTLCLALNKILPVTGFIPTEDEGPLKCLEPNSLPFMGFHVFSKILPTSSSYPIAEITKTLLSLGGARVLPSLDAFHTLQDGNYPRFFIYNSKSLLTQAILDKCASLHILPLQFMWVYESIGAFRAVPVMDFLDIGVHSRTLIRDYKIPDQLACSRYPRLEGEFHPQILDERYQRSL